MSDSIIDDQLLWLKRFHETEKGTLGRLAKSLAEELNQVSNCNQVIETLSRYLKNNSDSTTKVKTSINFFQKIQDWIKQFSELNDALVSAQEALKVIEPSNQLAPLITIINEILATPQSLLHIKALSLLRNISSPDFPKTLAYIAALENTPPPETPLSHSFAAQTPVNELHATGQQLLNNVAAVIKTDENNPNWMQANGLLQNSILIYIFIKTPQKKEEEKEVVTLANSSNTCKCLIC